MTRTALYVTPTYFGEEAVIGGGERYPINLARGLVIASEGRWRVRIVSFGATEASWEIGPGVSMDVLPVAHEPRHPLDPVSWRIVDEVADADLVHIHQIFTRCGEAALLAAGAAGVPTVVTDHGGRSSNLARTLGALAIADATVCYSQFAWDELPSEPPRHMIRGGVDTDFFTPDPAALREGVLYVGRLLPHKGVDRLIAACPADVPLTICGRPARPEYDALLAHMARSKPVTFVHDADDATIRDLYRRSCLTVLPSVHKDVYGDTWESPELMGLTTIESMACGTPAAVADTAALPEYVAHGETGFVFGSIDELTAVIRRMADDAGERERIGAEARRRTEAELGLASVGATLCDIYASVLGARVA